MNWYTIFYWFSLADKINIVFGALTIVLSIILGGTILSVFFSGDWDEDEWRLCKRFFFWFAPMFFISISLWTFTPSKRDMLMIVAGGAVGEFVATDSNAKKLPADITKFLRKEILEATAELDNPEKIKEALGLENEVDKLKKMSKEQLIEMLTDKEK